MRIAFDAFWWLDGPPSGRNVVKSLVDAWIRSTPDDVTIVVPATARATIERELATEDSRCHVISYPKLHRNHAVAVATASPLAAGFDWLITQNFAPIRRRGNVATFVHDAMFVDHPEWFGGAERAYLSGMRRLLRGSNVVWTSSRTEAGRIERVWPELRGRTEPIGLAPSAGLSSISAPIEPSSERPYILAVGRVNVRKNLGRLIEAYTSAPDLMENADLVVAGPPDNDQQLAAARVPEGGSIRFTGYVSDAELAGLYAGAQVFVFPSLDEGFGMPLVEARMFGAPIIASDISVFRELGVADDYFDPRSVADIARSLRRFVLTPRAAPRSSSRVLGWEDVVGTARDSLVGVASERSVR
ncbi:glycosyltransferase family 4 protein [Streptomyces sp. ISL-90]|nr:glycosyltransferase family 4 protein [Streptomyces sp. ISL-90]